MKRMEKFRELGLKEELLEAIEELGFELDNPEHIFTRTYYNKYQIKYPISEASDFIKPFLYVETAIFMKPFPYEIKDADTYIYRFLKEQGQDKKGTGQTCCCI